MESAIHTKLYLVDEMSNIWTSSLMLEHTESIEYKWT